MMIIETQGTWREIGRQVGEAFREKLVEAADHFLAFLDKDPHRYAASVAALRRIVEAECPDAVEEAAGMAEASGIDADRMLTYRFFNEIKPRLKLVQDCAGVFMRDAAEGPLLGRDCDLGGPFDTSIQLLHICRPKNAPAMLTFTHLGMMAGVGLNEHGLGLGGASAHTPEVYGSEGVPGQVFRRRLLQTCATADDARRFAAETAYLGKPSNLIAADAGGDVVMLECVSGCPPVQVEMRAGASECYFTNFFASGKVPVSPEVDYLENAYARYGCLAHRFGTGAVARNVEGLKALLTEIAQPGPINTGRNGKSQTAYSFVIELAQRRVHYAAGHPAEVPWEVAQL